MIMMGDSLSDRGKANSDYILGCIPMSWLTGLNGTSPKGRFTNGYVWADILSSFFANDFLIKELKKKFNYSNEDIADAVIHKKKWLKKELSYEYNLDNNLYVKYEGRDFIRSYDEGGLSAYNYAWWPSTNIIRFFSRIFLASLKEMRDALLKYDKKHQVSKKHKAQTLIIEWSGANDLITVNAEPSKAEVDRAIKERIKNVEILLKNGYRNFVLFNLPDLSLTPRFQNKKGEEGEKARKNAHDCVMYFNQKLAEECQKLQNMFPHCSFDVFDANSIFTEAYHNPEVYGLDPEKLKQPYKTSPDFKMLHNGTSPATGYTFWDDIHPTADVHGILAKEFYLKYNALYSFVEPEPEDKPDPELNISAEKLENAFRTCYAARLAQDRQGFFGFGKSKIRYQNADLKEILKHAFCDGAQRTRDVITQLQWIDSQGKLNLNIPVLKETLEELQAENNAALVA